MRPVAVALALFVILASFMGPGVATASTRRPAKRSEVARDTMALRLGRLAYLSRDYAAARRRFEKVASDRPLDPDAHAWLALAWHRLLQHEKAWAEAHRALALDTSNVVAHDALCSVLNPNYGDWERADSDSSWTVALHGVTCDALDGDLWIKVWVHALERNPDVAARAVRGIHDSGVYGSLLYTQARWVLRDLPARAVLVFNGDSDFLPAVVLQQVEGFRPDVALVNLSLLNLDWYRRYARDQLGVPMPFVPAVLDMLPWTPDGKGGWMAPARALVHGWTRMQQEASFDRPLAFAATVDTAGLPGTIELCGPYSLVAPTFHGGEVDTAAVRRNVMSLTRGELTGEATGRGSRSPYQADAAPSFRHNVSEVIARHYRHCRDVGDDAAAEALRSWALSVFQGDALASEARRLRQLPSEWEAERRGRR